MSIVRYEGLVVNVMIMKDMRVSKEAGFMPDAHLKNFHYFSVIKNSILTGGQKCVPIYIPNEVDIRGNNLCIY